MAMPKVLILENDWKISTFLRAQLEGEVYLSVAETAAEARTFFERDEFDIIALIEIAPSEEGREASLVGPVLAREFRKKGYKGPLVAISNDERAQVLMKTAGCSHRCAEVEIAGLIRELLGLWPTTPA